MKGVNIESVLEESRVYNANEAFKLAANEKDTQLYKDASSDRLAFWETQAKSLLWRKKWNQVLDWQRPYAKWFSGGTLNACENCLDVHLNTPTASKAALIWEGEKGDVETVTYQELHRRVCKLSNVLTETFNVQKGDRVTIYMPMISDLVVAVLACARIGAIHSVVFGGFSAKSLKDRLLDSDSKLVITADGANRRGSILPLKKVVDDALSADDTPVTQVLVKRHIGEDLSILWKEGRDFDFDAAVADVSDHHEAEEMQSEDVLFILYTSGTTGKPKGIIHTTGGYMTHAKYSTKTVFDLKDEDIYFCTADVGWITGHTYLVYGPLANGATALMYEGAPDYPEKDRLWQLISDHKVSILYTAPTAIRAFMKFGDDYVNRHDLSSLRLLGTVGEPINPEAWVWYHDVVGKTRCPIVDTWWQTETGGIMLSNIPALNNMKPGFAGMPLPGISAAVLDQEGQIVSTGGGLLSLTEPWPSMLRGIWNDPKRFEEVYWSKFDTYFAGDGAILDDDGYYKVLGRVDDVLNVAGHRIGTMEIESALVEFESVAEAAVVGVHDEIKGQAILAFVILKDKVVVTDDLEQKLILFVAKTIGAIAKPKRIIFSADLPKTRSGKIMRRVLRCLANKEPVGDVTTLANPEVVTFLEGVL